MEPLNSNDFKIYKTYPQSKNTLSFIIIGPNTRKYRGIDLAKDEVYYLGYVYSPNQTPIISKVEQNYIIKTLVNLDKNAYNITLEDINGCVFYGLMCAVLTETLTDLMMLIISNKQIQSAKKQEIEKFLDPLRKAWESIEKPKLKFSLGDFLK